MKDKIFKLMMFCFLGLSTLLVGCGGGGGGGGGDDSSNPGLPQDGESIYIYEVKGLQRTVESEPGLTVQWTDDSENTQTMRIYPNPENSIGFTGTIDPVSGQVTISEGSGIDVYDGVSSFNIRVEEEMVLPYDAKPTSGLIWIQGPNEGDFKISLTLGGIDGDVLIEYDMDGDGEYEDEDKDVYTWEEFEDLWETPDGVKEELLLSCFGIDVCQFMLTQVNLMEYALKLLADNEDELNPGPYADTGDRFSDFLLTHPDGIIDQGNFTATWIDVSGEGDIGPGDTFELVNNQVWVNNEDSEDDFIFDGQINFVGFVDVVNSNDETERIGFEPYLEEPDLEEPGGVFMENFTEHFTMTEENEVLIDDSFTITGAFSIIFTVQ